MASPSSLLILGRGDSDYTDRNPARLRARCLEKGIRAVHLDYSELTEPFDLPGDTISVLLFFPYRFWNQHCETPGDNLPYGTSRAVFHRFRDFFLGVKDRIDGMFGDRVRYVVDPAQVAVDRDKIATRDILHAMGVPTAEPVSFASPRDLLATASGDRGVFIKCRYGAEGKGITYLHRERWLTNYAIEQGTIGNHGVYEYWPFVDFTGRFDLLEQLLQHEMIVEREVICRPVYPGRKFDVRAYVVDGKVPHFMARVNDPARVTTNYSQGANVHHHPATGLPTEVLDEIATVSVQASEAMRLPILGVDIMLEDGGGPRVIEVQTFCDFPSVDRFNLAAYLASSGLF